MEKVKCADCGTLLDAGLSTCPKCGGHTFKHLPVSEQTESTQLESKKESKQEPDKSPTSKTPAPSNKMPLISFAIGIVIMIIGFVTISLGYGSLAHKVGWFSLSKVTFGGDFYTEIYNASFTMAKILSSIDEGLAVISKAIFIATGLIVEAIGLAVVAFSLLKIKEK